MEATRKRNGNVHIIDRAIFRNMQKSERTILELSFTFVLIRKHEKSREIIQKRETWCPLITGKYDNTGVTREIAETSITIVQRKEMVNTFYA